MPPRTRRRSLGGSSPKFDPQQRELVWKAVAAFREKLPTLRGFARAASGNNKLEVEITTSTSYTKGNTVYIQPPLEMGRDNLHDRQACGRRAYNGKQLCPACQVNEVIDFFIFHELGHVIHKSEMKVNHSQIEKTRNFMLEWHPEDACNHYQEFLDKTSFWNNMTCMQVFVEINRYLPMINNCLEDTRVNEATFRARPGLRGVFDANINRIMEEGAETEGGKWSRWIDKPLDAQFMIGMYLVSSGHYIEGRLNEAVVTALRTPNIQAICEQAAECKNAYEVMDLSIKAFRAAQLLGYCVVPKCELEPQLPGQPPDQDEGSDSDEASDDESSEDSEGSDSDKEDSPEESDDSESEQAPSDPDEEADGDTGDSSSDDGEAGEPSDDEEVENETAGDADSSESPDADSSGERCDPSSEDDAREADESADSSDGADSDGSDDEAERSKSERDEEVHESELDQDEGHDGGQSSDERAGSSDNDDVPSGEQDGSEQPDDAERGDVNSQDDGSGVDSQDDPGSQGDESSPVDEDASDAEEDVEEEECDHVGEGECELCGADLAAWNDDPWDTETGDEMVPVDRAFDDPSDPVDGTEPETPTHGTPDDAETALGRFLMHPTGKTADGLLNDMADGDIEEMVGASEHEDMDEELGQLVKVAVRQSAFFETDSGVVEGVEIPTYPEDKVRWNIRQMARSFYTSPQEILKSVTPDEGLIAAATMRMRRLFQENMMTRRNRNLRSGRLEMRSLARRAPVQDDRLFGKKEKPRGKSYSVVIGLDCSGSTDEDERNLRIKRIAMAQAEILDRLGIPWAGFGHTAFRTQLTNFAFTRYDGPYYVYLLPFKAANEQWTPTGREKLAAIQPLSENLDGHTLEQYINASLKIESEERIILYYTDGEMPMSNYNEEREVLIRQCQRAKEKGIHLIGVGINTNSPSRYGMETVQVDSDEDISKVIDLLEKKLSR